MAECVFCKIIAGQVPAAMLLETDKAVSFLDINPVNPGHALVMPRRHVTSMLDLRQDELHVLIFIARRLAAAILDATGAEGFNLLLNSGRPAGQIIDHAHMHVIPRRSDDGFSLGWRQQSYEEGELERLQRAIRDRL